jgi:hypothetical protein
MRTILFSVLVAVTATSCTQTSTDSDDQLDAPGGKADGSTDPSGVYSNSGAKVGELSALVLNDDHSFTASQVGLCPGGGSCAPQKLSGTFLFTHSSSKHYIHFYDADGTSLDRFVWKMSSGNLELELDGDSTFFAMTAGGSCEDAGGSCVALSPGSCSSGTVADASEYSCNTGLELGIECCLPAQADNSCDSASDCSGSLPSFCTTCSDGSQACAHWSCESNSCQIVSCE